MLPSSGKVVGTYGLANMSLEPVGAGAIEFMGRLAFQVRYASAAVLARIAPTGRQLHGAILAAVDPLA